MDRHLRIVVAGAGIGGLATALALLQRGFDVEVYEQTEIFQDAGAGVQLAPDGTRLLISLGLQFELEAVVCEAAWKEVRLWNTGEARRLFDLGRDSLERFGAPYWFVHRGDLHTVLLDAVRRHRSDAVRTGATAVGYRQDPDGVELELSDGRRVAGDVLVGADGVHSRLRAQMAGSGRAEFAGIIAWRGLAPMDRLPEELRQPVGTNWVGPGGHVITYPVRGGALLNFAGFAERDDWAVESWSVRGTREECAADFVGWHPLIHAVIASLEAPYKWALAGRAPLRTWTDGRVTLVGDACHPTLPFLAHGAIMALEDAIVLARCLEAHGASPEQALTRYEGLRVERTSAIVEGSAANAKRFHNPHLANPETARTYLDEQWRPDLVRQRYDWLFEYDATAVPIGPPDTP